MRTSNPLVPVLLSLCAGSVAYGQSAISWAAPVSGSFHVGANWVGGVRPQVADDAIISATGTGGYTVRVDNTAINTVNRLVVNGDASTTVSIFAGSELRVVDPLNSVFNTGVINIGSINSTSNAALTFNSPDSRLNGNGLVVLAGFPDPNRARLQGLSQIGSFVVGSNVTIVGAGTISSTGVLFNNGTIRSNVAGVRCACLPMRFAMRARCERCRARSSTCCAPPTALAAA